MKLRWSWSFIFRVGFVRADYGVWDPPWEAVVSPPPSIRLAKRASSNNTLILALVGSLTLLLVLIAIIVVVRSRVNARTTEDPESGIRHLTTPPANISDAQPPPVPQRPACALLRLCSKRMTELRTTRYVPPTPSPTKYVDRPLPPLPAGEATPQGTEFRSRTTSLHLPRRSGAVANPSMSASHSVGLQGGQHHPRLGAAIKQSHPNLNQHLSTRGGVIRKPSHAHSNSRGSFLSMTDSEPAFETTEGSHTAYQSETASAKYSNKPSTENSTLEAPSKIPRLGIPTNPRPKKPKSLEALVTRTREPPTPPTTITSWLVDDPLTPSLWVPDISQEASPTPPRSEHRPQIPSQPGYPARKRHLETTVTPGLRLLRTRAKLQPESRRSSSVRTNTMSPADSVDIIGELDKLKALIAESGRSQIVRPPTFVGRLEGN